ncbi:MAG TPA: acetolactate decarboxylase [Methanospirillum sp.]|uniref:acetolactate decarboxylase n=1 Tax=Methanospirillum sp. TaxID=45200 RepID=UPI002BA26E6E|nr:acetolactate decarboxylase [Methanospirillum sp.]HWQ64846.1 acetolactate decarboxylase [Methanospirillum sp.]
MRLYRILSILAILTVLICAVGFPAVTAEKSDEDLTSQAGVFSVLEEGNYDRHTTVDDMNKYGDFGVGGFESMDGELIQINGTVYQVTSDGVVHTPPGDTGVTFMNTVWFNPEQTHEFSGSKNLTELEDELNQSFPSRDCIYAIRVDGFFPEMKVRSVPVQQKPYPALSSVIANQSVFNLTNTSGTISGFWFPAYMQGVNYAGFHLHYISADKTAGGHILGLTIENGTAMMDPIRSVKVSNEELSP